MGGFWNRIAGLGQDVGQDVTRAIDWAQDPQIARNVINRIRGATQPGQIPGATPPFVQPGIAQPPAIANQSQLVQQGLEQIAPGIVRQPGATPGSVDWQRQRQQELATQGDGSIQRQQEMQMDQQQHQQEMRQDREKHLMEMQQKDQQHQQSMQQQQDQAQMDRQTALVQQGLQDITQPEQMGQRAIEQVGDLADRGIQQAPGIAGPGPTLRTRPGTAPPTNLAQQQQAALDQDLRAQMQREYGQLQQQQITPWRDLGAGGRIGRIADIAGEIIAPHAMSRIPGTMGYKQAEQAQLEQALEKQQQELTAEGKQARLPEAEQAIQDRLLAQGLDPTDPAARDKARVAIENEKSPGTWQAVPDPTNPQNIAGWVSVKTREFVPVTAIAGVPQAPGGGVMTKLGQQESAQINQARIVNEMIPGILDSIDQNRDQLGPFMGRWNEAMQGKLGLKNEAFANLRGQLFMLSSAVALAHARGRLPEHLRKDFDDMLNAPQQTPENLIATIRAIQPAMQRAQDPRGVGATAVGGGVAAAGAGVGAGVGAAGGGQGAAGAQYRRDPTNPQRVQRSMDQGRTWQ